MTATPPANPFLRSMMIVVLAAGLIWLGLALYNVRQGSSFSWTGLTVFLVVLAGLAIAGSRGGTRR